MLLVCCSIKRVFSKGLLEGFPLSLSEEGEVKLLVHL